MNEFWKRSLCLLLALVLTLGLLPASVLALEQMPEQRQDQSAHPVGGVVPDNMDGGTALTDAYVSGRGSGLAVPKKDTLPGYYDARSSGCITSVKNQAQFGTCWAHATMASLESSMIRHGVPDGYTGYAAAQDIDLSELHLAWFAYTNAYDAKGMLAGDWSEACLSDLSPDEYPSYLNRGGNGQIATFTLMRWTGATSEHWVNYDSADSVKDSGLDSSLAYQYDTVHLTDADWIPTANRNAVKNAILEHGAGLISYYHQADYLNASTGGYCYVSPSGSQNTNHAVTVVGWDDSYSRYNFNWASLPSSDGAWICKNSWGAGFGQSGYFYLSYEDTASLNSICCFFRAAAFNNYDNNYQYDGTACMDNLLFPGNCDVANVYTAAGPELLRAVAISTMDENLSYTLRIYRNPKTSNPTSGTLMCTQSGVIPYWGYHTIPLDSAVPLTTGDTFSVVFSLSSDTEDENGFRLHVPYDATCERYYYNFYHVDRGSTSFYRMGGSWADTPYQADFRIKAYTDNASWSVSAYSKPGSLGTLAFEDSYHLTASPVTCAYVSEARLVSGEGRCYVDGNRITVAPYSDCQVEVVFDTEHDYRSGHCIRCGAPEPLAPPVVKVTHVASTGKVRLTWDKVDRAESYEVYRYDAAAGVYKLAKTVKDERSYVNSSGTAGNTYYYAVRAMNSEVAGEFSQVLTGTCRLPYPVVTAAHGPDTGKPKLTWKKVSGAVKYTVYRATSKTGTYTAVKTTTSTTFIDSDTTLGKTYVYRVKAVAASSDVSSAKSPAKSLTRRLARPTVKGGHVAATGKNKLTWNRVSGAVKYEVYRAAKKTDTYKLVFTTKDLTYTNTGAAAGKTYYYKVRAIGSRSALNSAKTDAKGIVCDLPRPVVSVTRSSGKPKLSWKKITGAVKYKVYRAVKKTGTYSLKKTTTSCAWTDTAAVKGKTYYYRVVAVHTKSTANSAKSLVKYISATK